jgi:hypothetical protein
MVRVHRAASGRERRARVFAFNMKRESREVWTQRVSALEASGLPIEKFAADVGVSPHTLRGWKYRLAAEKRSEEGIRATAGGMSFIEIGSPPLGNAAGHEQSSEPFEVCLRSGLSVRVPLRFDENTLKRLVQTLGGL